jgi:hypothetical protein
VPCGQRYGYDLIAHVGRRTFLDGCRIEQFRPELPRTRSGAAIPTSSIYDAQHKFLFYLGQMHRRAAAALREHIGSRDGAAWLIDGTVEPGTPCFFGVQEAQHGVLLGSWKLPTENTDDVAQCLTEIKELYGPPATVLLDLSDRLSRACRSALPEARQKLCDFHFARDVGDDLYRQPQRALSERLRKMKLQLRLKDQRSGQSQRLRRALANPNAELMLAELLDGGTPAADPGPSLGSEVLLAFHSWMLDYRRDGRRQGFPFDPYLLYFHRRILQVNHALHKLVHCATVWRRTPRVLLSFAEKLGEYVADPVIAAAAGLYETAFSIFERLRNALRLSPNGPDPMADGYVLEPDQQQSVARSLAELREECAQAVSASANDDEAELYQTVNTHLDRHAARLLPTRPGQPDAACAVRTTVKIEQHWWRGKRGRRQTNGRRKLTRDFTALPAEFMLVPNLNNPSYVEIVLGSLDNLPAKLAEAGRHAPPFSHWRRQTKPESIGRLPRRLLRRENFVQGLLDVCVDQS